MMPTALVVEPYLSGGLLPGALKRAGVQSIGVHIRHRVGKVADTFMSEEYPEHIVYQGSIVALREQIGDSDVVAVMAGQEAGVELADQIAQAFGVAGNEPRLSIARRDKYLMHEAIRATGLRAIRQFRADNAGDLVAWAREANRWPVVVKPVNSGGTDGVRFCANEAAVAAAFSAAAGRINLLGFPNREMLVQERIVGVEYIVDTVTCKGAHHVVNIARYEKEVGAEDAPIYRTISFIDPAQWPDHQAMTAYVFGVLDALGIVTGPAHSEVFSTSDGPVLVETGARLCGAMVPRYLDEISSRSILDLTVNSYLDPNKFAITAAVMPFYTKTLRAFVMRAYTSGKLVSRPGDRLVRGLRTFRDVIWYGDIGTQIIPTRDLLSGLGMVFLQADDEASIDADISELQRWESAGAMIDVI